MKVLIDGINYELDTITRTASVCAIVNASYCCRYSGNIVIPSITTYQGIPYCVTNIGNSAFWYCGLFSIFIPDSVTSIGSYAFCGCKDLSSIIVDQNNPNYDSRNNCNAIIETATNILIAGCEYTIIPDSVTSIGESAFMGCWSLASITIPDSVTSIGESAFKDCGNLSTVTIPNNVASIAERTFYGCISLSSVNIPDSVISIGEDAFADTPWIARYGGTIYINKVLYKYIEAIFRSNVVTIRQGTLCISGKAFTYCRSLIQIVIPNSVRNIGKDALYACQNLTSIHIEQGNPFYDSRDNCNAIIETATNNLIAGCQNTIIPNTVNSIGENAFYGCRNLISIAIPNGVTSIGNNAFRDCEHLQSINIPNSVVSIGDFAFSGCKKLISITIPNSVKKIGTKAFEGVLNVCIENADCSYGAVFLNRYAENDCYYSDATKSTVLGCYRVGNGGVSISNKAMSIADGAFAYNLSLTSITIPDSVTSIGERAFEGCTGLTSITIPDGVTSIGELAFCGCSSLTSITISDGVTSIGDRAFEKCSLTSIIIPDSVTSIGDSAFKGCWRLASVTIPDSVTSIGDSAFAGCTSLTSIIIPDSVTSIGAGAFSGCYSLTSITIPDTITSIGDDAFKGCWSLTSITIPNSVTRIDSEAFCECSSLTSITLPNSVTSMGDGAFKGCWRLASVTIPNSVTSIGDSAFKDCSGLTSLTFPDSVTRIGDGAFKGCRRLASVTIPDSVTSIGDSAFEGCTSLTSIIISDSITSIGESAFCGCSGLTSITIPDSVTSIGESAFRGCSGLTSITIPDSVTSIENGAFIGCCGLTSITLPDSVTSIENGAFIGCSGLTSITIPDSVTSIGESAFRGCSGLTSLTIPDSVTSIEGVAFRDTLWLNNQPDGLVYINNVLYEYKGKMPQNTNIVVCEGTLSISDYAFAFCSGLTSITIPNSIMTIGENVFEYCDNLRTIRIPKGKQSIFHKDDLEKLQDKFVKYISAQVDGVQYELDDDLTAVVCALVCAGEESMEKSGEEAYMGSVVIPARVEQEGKKYTVNRLAARAFADCEELTAVTLPKSITEIGAEVFCGCENLQTIRVPQGMTEQFCEMGLEPWRDKIVEPRQEEYTILLNIARGYEQGIGMPRNPAQAVLLYSQAADKGCADAAYHLGELYEEGLLLPQDYQQAADWFGKAAALYHPNAATRRQACLRIIEEENARLAEMQQEQQAQLDRLAQTQTTNNKHTPMKTILFFDTETNGLPRDYKAGVTSTSNWPRMIQLGWIITDEQGNVLKQESRLIYPDFVINEAVTRLTGITTDQARREGTDISEVLPEFMADVENASLLVGHNIDFDRHIVGCEMVRMHSDPRTLMTKPAVCTMQRSTNFCAIPSKSSYHTGYKYPTLTELYTKLFGHAFSGAHDALADITATKECYFELCKRGVIRNA